MNKYNTILGQMLDVISRSVFEKLVKKHKTEYKAKGLRSWVQFVAMTFAQITGQHGLRSIVEGFNEQRKSWYHLGISAGERDLKRSSLSYANKNRKSDIFKDLYGELVQAAQKLGEKHKFKFKNALYSIDATTITLCLKLFPWAEFRKEKGGIKLNVKLDHNGKIPCFVKVSNAKEHESRTVNDIPIEAGDVVVFDRGYAKYGYYAKFSANEAWFVTRLKSGAVYKIKKERKVKDGVGIISDTEIVLGKKAKEQELRKIVYTDSETNKELVFLTNNLEWEAETIAAIYKERWQIELFFKAMKQNLVVNHFYGNSKNAVLTQIWIALIVYLLFYILKKISRNTKLSFTYFISLVKVKLFQRSSLYEWLCEKRAKTIPKKTLPKNLEFVW